MESALQAELQLPAGLLSSSSKHITVQPANAGICASLSLTLSDSEGEESGYLSCTSSEQKARGFVDIENTLTSHSESSNGSLNDLSSGEQNDSQTQNRVGDEPTDVDEMTSSFMSASLSMTDMTSTSTCELLGSTHLMMVARQMKEPAVEEMVQSSDEETGESDGEDNEVRSNHDEDGGEEDEDDGDEETVMRNLHEESYSQQTTLIQRKQDDSCEKSSNEEEEGNWLLFPEKNKNLPSRMVSTESDDTWISDSEEKFGVSGEHTVINDADSDSLDTGDFFEMLGDGKTYSFQDADMGDTTIPTYPSTEFFHGERLSRSCGVETDVQKEDDAADFAYIYSNDLKVGKQYAFPRKEPRTITDAVDFWETDFEVKGSIYPCMASWQAKSLVPTYKEDAEDFDKFNMYKSLYEKWVKCNRSREQWAQRYWGRSMESVAKMKGPTKMVTSQSDGAIDYKCGTLTSGPPGGSSPNTAVAERRRRRRNDSMEATRGSY